MTGRSAVAAMLVGIASAIHPAGEAQAMQELGSRAIKVLTLETSNGPDGLALVLRGLVQHSAQTVKRVEHMREGSAIRVRVWSGLGSRGESGGFETTVPLGRGVSEVRLGIDGATIWTESER